MKTIAFPSIIESHDDELLFATPEAMNGAKIYENGTGYIVGDLALSEGVSPTKAVNSAPRDLDYRLLVQAGLLTASQHVGTQMTVTTGFPFSTFLVNREETLEMLHGAHQVRYDAAPTNGGFGSETTAVTVADIEVIPEILGCNIAARSGPNARTGNFFLVSLGYGTCEAALCTDRGIVQRTLISASGLRHAVDLAMKELGRTHYLGMRNEFQFDNSFMEGEVVLNRQKLSLAETRRRSIERYYNDVLSPVLRNAWRDDDFRRTPTLVLAGGGSLYADLVECFRDEFEGILDVQAIQEPLTAAARGYYYRSLMRVGEGQERTAVGLDIGNSHTVVAFDVPEQAASEA